MNGRLRTILINLAVLAGLLLALELGVRMAGPDVRPAGTDRSLMADSAYGVSPGLRPGASGLSDGTRFTVDDEGFWRYEAARDSGPAWLFLGDSVTMGIGVDPDSTFAGRIAAGSDLRVLNPSLIGYAIADYERVLDAVLARGDVRRVTLFWCLNDLYDDSAAGGDPGAQVRSLGGPVLRFLQRHVRIYQVMKALALDRPRSYFEYVARQYDEASASAAAHRIAAMGRRASTAGATFDIVLLPYEYQLREAGHFGPQALMDAALEADSVRVLDASGALLDAGVDPSDLYLFGDGIHFSARGHAVLADVLADDRP